MNKINRGVVYFTFGAEFPSDLERSVESVRENTDLDICWITESVMEDKSCLFDYVVTSENTLQHGYHRRAATIFDKSPFDYTLSLDSDTVVCGNLDFGFKMAQRHHVAICHAPAVYGGTYIRSSAGLNPIEEDLIIYNCGVIFFDKSEETQHLFARWQYWNSLSLTGDDQSGLAIAVYESSFNPFVLSKCWNFRPGLQREGHGPIRIWHGRQPLRKDLVAEKRWWRI